MRNLRCLLLIILVSSCSSNTSSVRKDNQVGEPYVGLKHVINNTLKIAKQGDAEAQYNQGLIYFNGKGVPQDYKQAAMWYRKAAEQGHAQAQYDLGSMYSNGKGVVQDDKKAYMWLNVARINGVDITNAFDILISSMTTKNINEAKNMSNLCLESNYQKCN
ncbi:tetratricopeptide repeat protein [Psychromonas antarctica]|uniref:tetratricopeptide repeat protein n=1 Tax=Psychromonas antarctica TaxID=67573 RepID=UPI0023B147D2|nr:tetratricopeptide repeat protein [Psychromonas antarctica]